MIIASCSPIIWDANPHHEKESRLVFYDLNQLGQFEAVDGPAPYLEVANRSGANHIVFFIHGFNTQPIEAIERAQFLQKMADQFTVGQILIVPVLWRCGRNIGITRDYYLDKRNAKAAAGPLAELLKDVAWIGHGEKNHILAHSMGNRVFRYAMGGPDPPCAFPLLTNSFMVASDVPADTFAGNGATIAHCSDRVHIYHAKSDRALDVSQVANLGKRLGDEGPRGEIPDNVRVIDCDGYNTQHDRKGHTYFGDAESGVPSLTTLDIISQICYPRRSRSNKASVDLVLNTLSLA